MVRWGLLGSVLKWIEYTNQSLHLSTLSSCNGGSLQSYMNATESDLSPTHVNPQCANQNFFFFIFFFTIITIILGKQEGEFI